MYIIYTAVIFLLATTTAISQTPGSILNMDERIASTDKGMTASDIARDFEPLGLTFAKSFTKTDFELKALGLWNVINVGSIQALDVEWGFTMPLYGSIAALSQTDLTEQNINVIMREVSESSRGLITEFYPLSINSKLKDNLWLRLYGGGGLQFDNQRDSANKKDIIITRGMIKTGVDITIPGAQTGILPPSLSLYFNLIRALSEEDYKKIYNVLPEYASWFRVQGSIPIINDNTVILVDGRFGKNIIPVWSIGFGVIGNVSGKPSSK